LIKLVRVPTVLIVKKQQNF